ncbi:MAG: TAT-variant-translocated molybdopterin oxidoreductase [Myxococcota bacterium]
MKKLNVVNGKGAPKRLAPLQPKGEVAKAVVKRGSQFWSSLEDKLTDAEEKADNWKEFPEGAEELEVGGDGVSRRNFFGLIGSGAALAGMSLTTSGCIRKPSEQILPYRTRPEDMIPGKPMYYASAIQLGGTVEGILVESHDGRPTKIEGNPSHSGSGGGTSVYTQAAVLDLYDPDRSRMPMMLSADGAIVSDWGSARAALDEARGEWQKNGGAGLALVLPDVVSPTDRESLAALKARFPKARFFNGDPLRATRAIEAGEMLGGAGARYRYVLDDVRVFAAFDADFLGSAFPDSTRLAREWSMTRQVMGPTDEMSRMYVFEPHLTNTGTMADHRRRVRGSDIGDVLIGLANELFSGKYPDVSISGSGKPDLPAVTLDPSVQKMVEVLAKDLAGAQSGDRCKEAQEAVEAGAERSRYRPLCRSAVIVGERQPAWVHGVALLINSALRNTGTTVRWRLDALAPKVESLTALAEGLGSGIDTVLCVGTNPVYDAPADLGLAEKLAAAKTFHMGLYRNETGMVAKWHLPVSHLLESWGDLESSDGTISICQPLIDPLHDTYSVSELLHFLGSGELKRGSAIVKNSWQKKLGPNFSEKLWRRWLHDGTVSGAPRAASIPPLSNFEAVAAAVKKDRAPLEGMEVNFHVHPALADGRFANNAWLQELPHPLTKICWDNAAYLSPGTAAELGVKTEDMVTIAVAGGGSVELPVFIAHGQADNTVSVNLGGGRKLLRWDNEPGVVSDGAGFDVNVARTSASPWIASGTLTATGKTYAIANTQDYGSLKPPAYLNDFKERPIVLDATVEEFSADPNFVEKANLMPEERIRHLWDPPKLTGKQQWGKAIDLNTCTGCMSCVIACQAENNIPVVGKEQVINGREMHWLRIDRYFRTVNEEDKSKSWEDVGEVEAVFQPMSCQMCESAPCESVCPVAATVHSPEGLNDMVYNRCIGTRYCSNNCPYKVRRYNFFNYNLALRPGGWKVYRQNDQERKELEGEDAWIRQMQKNPDVTVRFRGVMEKCTYCVQRINAAKIEAHVAGEDVVPDGTIIPACQQACPTKGFGAFGDIHDPDSKVSKAKRSPRNYAVLRDLNTQPRTTYLARIRNPHPELA